LVIQLLATWIPALLIALSGALKLSGSSKIVATMKLGFMLASCYFGAFIRDRSICF
jgi:hypothetical protein